MELDQDTLDAIHEAHQDANDFDGFHVKAFVREMEARGLSIVAWQPIETAPKDGTPILVARDMGDTFGWVLGHSRWDGARGIYGWISGGFSDPPGNLGLAAPTLWQPLPSPPPAEPAPQSTARGEAS